MSLREYLADRGMSVAEAAAVLGVLPRTLHHISARRRRASGDLAARLHAASRGEIPWEMLGYGYSELDGVLLTKRDSDAPQFRNVDQSTAA